jgi:Rrf2 family protein
MSISDRNSRISMLRLTKKADYGLMALKHLAEYGQAGACSAKDVAEAHRIPQELLAKILQRLVRAGLLKSQPGKHGGYVLAREPATITAFEVIGAIDGPLFITSCVTVRGNCVQHQHCTIKEPMRKVNASIEEVLRRITIAQMAEDGDQASGAGTEQHGPQGRKKPTELVTIR